MITHICLQLMDVGTDQYDGQMDLESEQKQ